MLNMINHAITMVKDSSMKEDSKNEVIELLESYKLYRVKSPIKPRKCMSCNKEDCMDCNNDFNRCPNCNEVLDDDVGSEPKYCPECGKALLWYTEDGFSLRG